MEKQNAEWLLGVAVDAMFEDFEIRKEYSGRGMHGKTTTALECNSVTEFISLMFAAVDVASRNPGDVPEEFTLDADRGLSFDSMGQGVIVY